MSDRRAILQNLVSLGQMIESCLYKTAHCNYRNKTRPYPLIPQVMNGTGALRQFVPKVARHSSRAAFGLLAGASLLTIRNDRHDPVARELFHEQIPQIGEYNGKIEVHNSL